MDDHQPVLLHESAPNVVRREVLKLWYRTNIDTTN